MRKGICLGALLLLFTCLACAAMAQTDTPLYTGVANRVLSLRETEDREAKAIAQIKEREKLTIYGYSPEWLDVEKSSGERGYVLRQHVVEIERLDTESTLPYGAVIHRYTATITADTHVYAAMDFASDVLCDMTQGARFSVIRITDGWAEVPYQRQIGYVHASMFQDLTPLSPTVEVATSGDMIASYTSYYAVNESELNIGRMVNIELACDFISIELEPGQQFSFNGIAGPYRKARGYMPAPVLIDGTSVPGFGGGTCQVSSTLYNVLLQLDEGIEIVKRRPHGPAGAKYLPHGVDAAVGNENLDLVFQNAFPFPIRIDASAQDGALYISIYKV